MPFLAAILSEAMAASSGDDIKTQLANILGRPLARIGQIRKTDETPPRISVIDVVIVITGKNASNAARDVGFLKERYPDVIQKLSHVKLVDSPGHKTQHHPRTTQDPHQKPPEAPRWASNRENVSRMLTWAPPEFEFWRG